MSSLRRELLTRLSEDGVLPLVPAGGSCLGGRGALSGIGRGFRLGGRGALSGIGRESSQRMVEGRSDPGEERETPLLFGSSPSPTPTFSEVAQVPPPTHGGSLGWWS